jgi:hypothetical protein
MLRIGRALGSEGLALGSVGNRRELSTGTCLTEAASELAGIEPTPPTPKGAGYVRLDNLATVGTGHVLFRGADKGQIFER